MVLLVWDVSISRSDISVTGGVWRARQYNADEYSFCNIFLQIIFPFYTDAEKLSQDTGSLSPLAAITGVSLFIILSICLLFVWKKYQLHRGKGLDVKSQMSDI